jgi:hypothetical protein
MSGFLSAPGGGDMGRTYQQTIGLQPWRLACIVWTHSGAVGACVAASLVPAGQATIDWGQLRAADKAAERSAKSVAASLNYVAAQRIHTALLTARRDDPIIFVVRFR